jgi:hypothetical protein
MNRLIDGIKSVVIVHEKNCDDPFMITRAAGLEPPLQIRSFTDLVTAPNPHNADLYDSVQGADVVLLQKSGLGISGSAVELAMRAVLSAPVEELDVLIFNEDYTLYEQSVIPEGVR